jgi:hypothetical protein
MADWCCGVGMMRAIQNAAWRDGVDGSGIREDSRISSLVLKSLKVCDGCAHLPLKL